MKDARLVKNNVQHQDRKQILNYELQLTFQQKNSYPYWKHRKNTNRKSFIEKKNATNFTTLLLAMSNQ